MTTVKVSGSVAPATLQGEEEALAALRECIHSAWREQRGSKKSHTWKVDTLLGAWHTYLTLPSYIRETGN
jgi:hypothetical protein